ncbi:hypothetical protein [Rhizobium tumorigenes]|uniref:hypothetical protein n=1 Tax=Rhizobium tumorigenes TaxID=2041385 RepID=UPI00241ECBA2|nr:hypothetical protein [Rhizobium tumorigenes]WFS02756.1 hypothetical protein PR016_09215 [Rhizobium tumorigenes]
MIAFIAKLLGGSTLAAWVVVIALASGALTGFAAYVDHQGYQLAVVEYQSKIDKINADLTTAKVAEIERQDAANNAAKSREAERIARLGQQAIEIENLRKEQADAASQDPDRDKPALNSFGVQRINKFR